jgi:hypothetical protein
MTVRAGGLTQTATRPGSMIVTNLGSPPGLPTLLAQGALNAQLGALEGRRGTQSSGGGGGSGRNADQAAQNSGLSTVNSGQSVRVVAPGGTDNFGSGPGPRSRNPNDTIVTAVSNANVGVQQNFALQDQRQQQAIQQQVETPSPPLPPPPTAAPTSFPSDGTIPPPTSQPPTNLPQTGTVTYSGPMVSFVNGRPTATGTYQNTWNFGQNAGTVSANFQGANFQGSTVGGRGATFFTPQAIQSSNLPRKLELNGTFLGRASQPDFQFGNFSITSTNRGNYSASGLFLGEKR